MKRFILQILCSLAMLPAFAQIASVSEKRSDVTSEKKFNMGIGLGVGPMVQEASVMNAAIDMQGEFKPSHAFSLYSSLGYNRLFAMGEGGGSAGFATLVAGPRGYISKKVFVGVGGGIAYFNFEGFSASGFAYNPHIGMDSKKTQFTLGYNGIEDGGFVQGRVLFKF